MRAFKITIGVLLMIVGLVLIPLGIAGIGTFGTDGKVTTISGNLASGPESYALVTDIVGVSTGIPGGDWLGETTLGARGSAGADLFLGLASADQVDKYLRGAPYDVVVRQGGEWQAKSVPGSAEPKPARKQDIWARRATGPDPSVEYAPARSGSTTMVVMNSDGTRGVSAAIVVGYSSSWAFPLSASSVVLGCAALFFGVFGLYRGIRPRGRSGTGLPDPARVPTGADL